jgi:hypothetical protein
LVGIIPYGGFDGTMLYGNGFDGAIHSIWIWGIWIRGIWLRWIWEASDGIILTTATITFMVGKDITETNSTGRRGSINTNDNTNRNFSSRNNIITKLIEAITVEILIITLLETTTITTK